MNPRDGEQGAREASPRGSDPSEIEIDEVRTETTVIVDSVVIEEVVSLETSIRRRPPLHHVLAWLVLDRVRSMLSLLVLAAFVLTFIFQPFRIPSESMERTLLVGDFLLVNKAIFSPAGHWAWLMPYRQPVREDIVVFRFPINPEEHVVKRVIGVAGDRIHLHDGVVYRDSLPLNEPYTDQHKPSRAIPADAFRDDFPDAEFTDPGVDAHWWIVVQHGLVNGEVVVPDQRYFVMGDDRNYSRDSRYWGFVPRENIVGMPMLIYFSLRQPSRTDVIPAPDDRLGKSEEGRLLDFARWDRFLRVVH
jgi:signal peptidase I